LLIELEKSNQKSKFKNRDWIKDHGFQSFGCFPLIAKGITVGTLSLYTGYEYRFSPDTIDFLQGVADLLGAFILNANNNNVKVDNQETTPQEGVTSSPRKLQIDKQLEATFKDLATKWKGETEFLSSTIQISMHPSYQRIIGLGEKVIPLLLRELAQNQEPDHWFWALRAITGENPIPPDSRGRLIEMKKAWIEWGRERNYVFE
jgi:hypothetical protein